MNGHQAETGAPVPTLALVGGFLGAGKTTLLTAVAASLRQRGLRAAVVTNDQGSELVDTTIVGASGAVVAEVTKGCFCCRFDDLTDVVDQLILSERPHYILAEAVGSCTDLAATVVRPLQQQYGPSLKVAPLLVVVDPTRLVELSAPQLSPAALELGWLLHTQLEEADAIAVTKSDLDLDVETAVAELTGDYPGTPIQRISGATGHGLDELIGSWLDGSQRAGRRALELDYHRYGKAEALMAWSDVAVSLSSDDGFDPDLWLSELLGDVKTSLKSAGAIVGHVKAVLSSGANGVLAKGSLSGQGDPQADLRHGRLVPNATALVNARVGLSPPTLAGFVSAALDRAATQTGARCKVVRRSDFAPPQPAPTHRLPV